MRWGWAGSGDDRRLNGFRSQAADPDALCGCGVRTVFARMAANHPVNAARCFPAMALEDQTAPKPVPDNRRD